MKKQLYFIENMGCDATTRGLIELTDVELTNFCNFIYHLNKNSYYGCMPKISIYKGDWNELEEVDLNKSGIDDVLDDNFVDKDRRFWFEGKCYTFKDRYEYSFYQYPEIDLEKIKGE